MTSLKTLALVGSTLAMLGACSAKPATQPAADAPSDTAASAPAGAPSADAPSTGRVRGTVQAISDTALTIKTYDGKTVTVPMAADTGYAWVVASSLATLKDGDFIGTATTGPDTALKAVELVIFPEAMRGSGEGHYDWDVPGVVASKGGAAPVSSGMTNGTVASQTTTANAPAVQSGMTNGTVTGGAGASGGKSLTIAYKGGTANVAIPDGTPVVRFEPTQRASLAIGQKVFAVTPPGAATARFVAIGKDGLTPPM